MLCQLAINHHAVKQSRQVACLHVSSKSPSDVHWNYTDILCGWQGSKAPSSKWLFRTLSGLKPWSLTITKQLHHKDRGKVGTGPPQQRNPNAPATVNLHTYVEKPMWRDCSRGARRPIKRICIWRGTPIRLRSTKNLATVTQKQTSEAWKEPKTADWLICTGSQPTRFPTFATSRLQNGTTLLNISCIKHWSKQFYKKPYKIGKTKKQNVHTTVKCCKAA